MSELNHYGVKGMRWGHRKKDEESSGSTSSPKPIDTDDFKAAAAEVFSGESGRRLAEGAPKKLKEQAEQTFPFDKKQAKRDAKSEKLREEAGQWDQAAEALRAQKSEITGTGFGAKLQRKAYDSDIAFSENVRDKLLKDADKAQLSGLTTQQKALIATGALAVVGGVAAYSIHKSRVNAGNAAAKDENKRTTEQEWKSMFGEDFPAQPVGKYSQALGKSFHVGLNPPSNALDRPGFEIPGGHVFQRLSNAQEDSTRYGTSGPAYTTFLSNDKKLYGASGEFGGSKYTVNYTAKGPVKVPSTKVALAHYRQALAESNPGKTYTPTQVFAAYAESSGGGWKAPHETKFLEGLKKSGFSAIVDDMDAGFMGDMPIVFFGDANPATSTPRTIQDVNNDARSILKVGGRYT